MRTKSRGLKWLVYFLVFQFGLGNSGCAFFNGCKPCGKCPPPDTPKELSKLSLPAYVIEPPDILLIDAIRVVPLPPYKIEPLDAIMIQSTASLPESPISGVYTIEPDGTVNMGLQYGSVRLVGMTLPQAQAAIEKQLKTVLKDTKVMVGLAQSRAMQQIRGEHLVRPDGTVGLGLYGSVYVAGMTLEDAKAAIESQLSQFLQEPQVSVDVFAYNSKVYYIVIDGGGYGETVYRLPITGNETVMDAISIIYGLPAVASKHHMWLARPHPGGGKPCKCGDECCDNIMPIDWKSVAECGATSTNYQIFPGDRIFVKADTLISTDNWLAKMLSPVQRVFGAVLLGSTMYLSLITNPNAGIGGTGPTVIR